MEASRNRAQQKEAMYFHAKGRAVERYGVQLEREDMGQIGFDIKSGQFEFMKDTSNDGMDRGLYKGSIHGTSMYVIYCHTMKYPITFLTKSQATSMLPHRKERHKKAIRYHEKGNFAPQNLKRKVPYVRSKLVMEE